jgi:hypothetical protein
MIEIILLINTFMRACDKLIYNRIIEIPRDISDSQVTGKMPVGEGSGSLQQRPCPVNDGSP